MFNRKVAAKSASSIFYEEYNDVDVYVEDTGLGYRKIFKELLRKAFPSEFSIEQIFPIGSRDEVICECKKDQSYSGRKRVYIIDGDLHIINGIEKIELKGLFILPRYCIENFLLSKESIIHTAYEEDPEMDLEDIELNLGFDNWLQENQDPLTNLFILYAISHKMNPSEQTIGYKVSKLCTSNNGVVCPIKIDQRIADLKAKILSQLSERELDEEITYLKNRVYLKGDTLLRFVSGKDYLLPLIISRLKSFMKVSSNNLNLKLRLAMKSSAVELRDIKDYIFE